MRSTWSNEKNASLLLPCMERPRIDRSGYTLYNHAQKQVDTLHPGLKGYIRFSEDLELPPLPENIFIRA